jgi:uncharacterized membrane protein YhdT
MINLPLVLTYLLVAFIIMKVAGIIDWSWWLVVSPLYVPLAFTIGLIMFVVGGVIRKALMTPEQRKRHDTRRLLNAWAERLARGDFR